MLFPSHAASVPARQGGFNLVEILVIVAILGILATLAVPNIAGWRQRSQVNAVEQSLLAALENARSEALRRNGTVCLGFVRKADQNVSDWHVYEDKNIDAIFSDSADTLIARMPDRLLTRNQVSLLPYGVSHAGTTSTPGCEFAYRSDGFFTFKGGMATGIKLSHDTASPPLLHCLRITRVGRVEVDAKPAGGTCP